MPDDADAAAPSSDAAPAPADASESPEEDVRARVIRLGFGGDAARFDHFVQTLREALPPGVRAYIRGSAVVGERWANGEPFDSEGPGTSDLDLTLVGGGVLKLWSPDAMYIPGLHSAPLDEERPDAAPALEPLRRQLCEIAGRPVHFQATTSLVQVARDVLFDQPYHALIDGGDGDAAAEGATADDAAEGTPADDAPPGGAPRA